MRYLRVDAQQGSPRKGPVLWGRPEEPGEWKHVRSSSEEPDMVGEGSKPGVGEDSKAARLPAPQVSLRIIRQGHREFVM